MQVTICTANCVGQAGNCSYPNKVTVVTPEQLQEAVKKDHVCAEFKGNYRSIENFIRSDAIVMDIDNDHTEVPADWITAEKLEELFPNVEYLLAPSRHHLLDKEGNIVGAIVVGRNTTEVYGQIRLLYAYEYL